MARYRAPGQNRASTRCSQQTPCLNIYATINLKLFSLQRYISNIARLGKIYVYSFYIYIIIKILNNFILPKSIFFINLLGSSPFAKIFYYVLPNINYLFMNLVKGCAGIFKAQIKWKLTRLPSVYSLFYSLTH